MTGVWQEESSCINYREQYLNTILKLVGFLFLAAIAAGILLSFLIAPVQAIEINPSVDNQPFLCKYSLTKWIFCDTDVGIRGVNGTQGLQGLKGESNFSAIYYNASNFVSNQTNATFQGVFNYSTMYSNYTVFEGGTYTNINESYAYLPGRAGEQTITGGTTTGNLVLNGSANNGDVIIQPDGGFGAGYVYMSAPFYLNASTANRNYFTLQNQTSGFPLMKFTMDSTSNSAWYMYNSAGAEVIRFRSTPTGTISNSYINTAGKFGFKTTSPTSDFDQVGSTRFRNCSGTPTMDAGGNMTCASDPRLKTAVQPYISDTAKVASVAPIKYKWNAASGYDTTHVNTGFDAEQIKLIYPECVIARDDVTYVQDMIKGEPITREVKTGTQTLALDDKCLIAVLWNAAKDQDLKIKALEAKVDKLLLVKP